MSRFRFSVVGALVAVALLAPVAATAGVKVDVCHRSSDGSFQLINISENAFPAHVDHGDAAPGEPVPGQDGFVFDDTCTPIEDGPQIKVFARATSTDTAGGVHVLAEWVDTDGDGAVSYGDTVFVYQMPTAIPPGPADYVATAYGELSIASGFFLGASATDVSVRGPYIRFISDADQDTFIVSLDGFFVDRATDTKGLVGTDSLTLTLTAAGNVSTVADGDGDWLTVEIYI